MIFVAVLQNPNKDGTKVKSIKWGVPWVDPGFIEKGFICIKVWGFALLIFLIFLKYPMKNPPLVLTVWHHLASLLMPNGDPQADFFHPILTLMLDSNILKLPKCYNFW